MTGELPNAFRAVVAERRLLETVAVRMLGSAAAAKHAVRQTYARWYTLPADQQERIDSPLTWLVATLVRICVDLLVVRPRRGICRTVGARRHRR